MNSALFALTAALSEEEKKLKARAAGQALFGCATLVFAFPALFVLKTITLTLFWKWFLVPATGKMLVPELNPAIAFGIILTHHLIKGWVSINKDKAAPPWIWLNLIMTSVVLLVGWLTYLCI